jgi:hypothetical protein
MICYLNFQKILVINHHPAIMIKDDIYLGAFPLFIIYNSCIFYISRGLLPLIIDLFECCLGQQFYTSTVVKI